MLPPAVAGIGLLVAFGRAGLLGGTFDALGIDIAFTKVAVILAVTFVASPFYLRTAIAAFEAVDPTLPAAARTLGAGRGRVFFRVMLPLARGGLGAGAALAFARGLGEFGATIMFAGSLQGVTQTLSLAIYEQFDVDFDVALAISALLIVLSAVVLLSVKLMTRWRSGSASLTLFAASSRQPSLTVERGETLALVGPSGAGKTTVLRVVAGLLGPQSGSVALDDDVLLDTNRGIDVAPEHRRVGYLFQEYALFPHLDVRANVRFGARDARGRRDAARALPHRPSRPRARARALRRRAPARRARARARARPGGAPARRAALGARRAHARRRPRRAAGAPRRARAADAPRHPRLRGRRDARRTASASSRDGAILQLGTPDGARRAAARPVRRELHAARRVLAGTRRSRAATG